MAQNKSTAVFDVVFPIIKHNEVRRISELGKGTYGKVYQCFSLAVGTVAVKVCRIEDQEKLIGEVIKTLKYGAAHPNIVKVFGYYDDPRSGLSLVMEYMSGGSLMDVICKRKDLVYYVDHIVSWMYQISSAVAHMHKCNVLHRDLKPDNVLMNELYTKVKLCDLGEARVLAGHGEDMTSRVGSYLFMAPEVMAGPTYDGRADVFSLGMVFWMMFARRLPSFIEKYKTAVSFVTAIRKGERPSELPILKVFNDVIRTCMESHPEDRITSEKLRDFCAELVEQFPHGQHFLITVPESDKLYEPINVRGDVKESMTALIANPLRTVAPTRRSAPGLPSLPGLRPIEKTKTASQERLQQPQPRSESPDVAHFAPNGDPVLNSLRATLQQGTISQGLTDSLDGPTDLLGAPLHDTAARRLKGITDEEYLLSTLSRAQVSDDGPAGDGREQSRRAVTFEASEGASEHRNVHRIDIKSSVKHDITKTVNSIYIRSTRIPRNLVANARDRYERTAGLRESEE